MGNVSIAGDIAITIGDSMSECIVIAFQACDDTNDPLSLNQKRHIISACMTVVMESKDRIKTILDLDDLCSLPENVVNLFEILESDEEDSIS